MSKRKRFGPECKHELVELVRKSDSSCRQVALEAGVNPALFDLYSKSKMVQGWSLHHRQDRHMVVRAVKMAVWQREGDSEVILHSDRDGQFISGDNQKFLGGDTMVSSMSAIGRCADNAACEGFFGVLKRERVFHKNYQTRD